MRYPDQQSCMLRAFALAPVLACIPATAADLGSLSLEQLLDIEVTSVSKKPEKALDAAAAVFVITGDDIRRSGATSIPEALRLAPGVEVAQIDANKWAIGVRGFGSRLSRALLVLIDGRSVYTPLFAGVYWEVQDTLIEDIDRIEVIRGPGGTLWGANAVNGVINIVTRSAPDSQGGMLSTGAGSSESSAALRYGGSIGEDGHYRVYAKAFDRAASYHAFGNAYDDWRMGQAGFRIDQRLAGGDAFTLQGDAYSGRSGQRTSISTYSPPYSQTLEGDAALSGFNLLARRERHVGEALDLSLQAYIDHTDRAELHFSEVRDTVDFDLSGVLRLSARHQLTWGAGYRWSAGDFSGVPTIVFTPARRVESLFSALIQDEYWLVTDRLRLTLGTKLEHNDYSGLEHQPNARLLWRPAENHTFWAAVSRAVRSPSRVEHDLVLTALVEPTTPVYARLTGGPSFDSEKVLAYELGYRTQPDEKLYLDCSGFYNRYDHLLSVEPGTPFAGPDPPPGHLVVPYAIGNGVSGRTRGIEFTADWQPLESLRLHANQSFLWLDFSPGAGSSDTTTVASLEGGSPRHQTILRSSLALSQRTDFDVIVRHVGRLHRDRIPAYTAVDFRLARRLQRGLEVALTGRNLFDPHHPEFASPAGAEQIEVPRSFMLKLRYDW